MSTISCHSNQSSVSIWDKTLSVAPAYRCYAYIYYMWNMVRTCFMSSEMTFENVEDGRTTTRRMPGYTISSHMSFRLRWANDSSNNKTISLVWCGSAWYLDGCGFSHLVQQNSFVEIVHEIISTAILSVPLIQVGQLSVIIEWMCH